MPEPGSPRADLVNTAAVATDAEAARREAARLRQALAPLTDTLITPALVLDLDALEHNLAASVARFGAAERWRPHLKTSKQAVVVDSMLRAGLRHFKVATLDELALTLETWAAWAARPPMTKRERELAIDIVVAYPLQRAALAGALALLRAHAADAADARPRVTLLADSPAHLDALGRWAGELGWPGPLPVLLDVDLGMARTGAPPAAWRDTELPLTPRLALAGLHGYDGHLRWDERAAAFAGYDQLCALARELGARLGSELATLELLTSGTHSYAHALDHPALASGPWRHRISPGTIVLDDLRSAPAAADIGLRQAAYVASRVISAAPGRVTLDAGSKAITPDAGARPSCAVLGHPDLRPLGASEEHLPCAHTDPAEPAPELGELVLLIPDHVCTTVNLHREALWIRGDRCVGRGPVGAAGHRASAPSP
ncbi:alanine racemase [Pseudenhygromyxa sp. WMMC2535]|uniref:alanine racemase n=1 Tax=Pseudenhygromyxa sp. WMMC2535 TaxID=2712867 RepID=UPI0015525DC0|nr:alanine racemase [Pseudenhygromyxa sp. WMMC2535]NVB42485.1 alanine racemase [Pseudenhygromyxa sp. WMMC2535]